MHNNVFKVFCIISALIFCFQFSVSADYKQTVFSLNCAENGDVSFTTNNLNGVGGLDVEISYDINSWKYDYGSAKCALKGSEIVEKNGKIHIIWETIEDVELPEMLISASFKKLKKDAKAENMSVVIKEYYDNTVELRGLPYTIEYNNTEAVGRVKSAFPWWLVVLAVFIVAAGGACYYITAVKKIDILSLLKKKSKHS